MNADRDNQFNDELISAYLDGELTPEEKAHVEEQLIDCAEHRRIFNELRALRESLHELPQQQLDDEFAARVLRRAEQEKAVQPAEPTAAASGDAATRPVRRESASRGLLWAAAAIVAAALLVVVSNPFSLLKQGGDEVARTVPDAGDSAAGNTAAGNTAAENAAAGDTSAGKTDVAGAEQTGAEHAGAEHTGAEHTGAEHGNRTSDSPAGNALDSAADNFASEAGQQNAQLAKNRAARHAEAATSDRVKSHDGLPAARIPLPASDQSARRARRAPNEDAPNEDVASYEGAGAPLPNNGNAKDSAAALLENLHSAHANARDVADSRRSEDGARPEEFRKYQANKANEAQESSPIARPATAELGEGVLVVSLDVTREALDRRFIDEAFARHEIAVEHSSGGQQPSGRAAAGNLAAAAGVDLLYVTAPADKVDNLLNDLQSQGDYVLAMAIDQPQQADRNLVKQRLEARAFRHLAPSDSPPSRAQAAGAETLEPSEQQLGQSAGRTVDAKAAPNAPAADALAQIDAQTKHDKELAEKKLEKAKQKLTDAADSTPNAVPLQGDELKSSVAEKESGGKFLQREADRGKVKPPAEPQSHGLARRLSLPAELAEDEFKSEAGFGAESQRNGQGQGQGQGSPPTAPSPSGGKDKLSAEADIERKRDAARADERTQTRRQGQQRANQGQAEKLVRVVFVLRAAAQRPAAEPAAKPAAASEAEQP